jgi:hypothetical protein
MSAEVSISFGVKSALRYESFGVSGFGMVASFPRAYFLMCVWYAVSVPSRSRIAESNGYIAG